MINNYFEHEYHPSHKVYTHQNTSKSIFLGDISSALDLDFIKQQRIKTVVTAAVGMDHISYDKTVNHIVYPLLDMKSETISKYFSQFHDLVENQLAKGNILVHCAAGISRSATLVISYLMKKKNWIFREAIEYVRKSRPSVCPNLGFQRQLKEYQRYILKQIEFENFQKRNGAKTSDQRKHKYQILPEISLLGKTQLKSKILNPFSPQNIEIVQKHIPLSQRNIKVNSQPRTRKQQIMDLYQTKRMTFKPKKRAKSIQERQFNPYNINSQANNRRDFDFQKLKLSMPAKKVEEVVIKKMNMKEKMMTERNRRIKPVNRIGLF